MALQMSSLDLGWLAGFFDGEGWYDEFYVKSRHDSSVRYPVACLGIANTVKASIDHCQEITGAGRIRLNPRTPPRQPIWIWRLNKRAEVIDVLSQLEPHLLIKGDRASVVLANLRARSAGMAS